MKLFFAVFVTLALVCNAQKYPADHDEHYHNQNQHHYQPNKPYDSHQSHKPYDAHHHNHHVPIVHQEFETSPDGSYKSFYETGNGIVASEEGVFKQNGHDDHSIDKVVHGFYQYESNGDVIKVKYVADENGFHPESDVLPTPPPTPEAILKLLDYIRAHPEQEHDQHHEHHDNNYNRPQKFNSYHS